MTARPHGLYVPNSFDERRPRASPVQLAVVLRRTIVGEVLVAVVVGLVVHRARAENAVRELVDGNPADATAYSGHQLLSCRA